MYYCNICDTRVVENTKHCALCNRCCYEFDHHCLWVNNDIGELNYILFLRLLVFVICTFLVQVVLCTVTLTNTDEIELSEDQSFISREQLCILNGFTLAIILVFLGLVTYLFAFHIWLVRNNLTTFKWLKNKTANGTKSKVIVKNEGDHFFNDVESDISKEKVADK